MASSYKLGTTFSNLTSLDVIGIIDPRPTYKPHAAYIENDDFSVTPVGFPSGSWTWDFITNAQKALIVATYLPDSNAEIYIQTRLNDGTFDTFKVRAVYPLDEEIRSSKSFSFTILFSKMEAVTS